MYFSLRSKNNFFNCFVKNEIDKTSAHLRMRLNSLYVRKSNYA
ncbi:hypothetical protein HMPREF9554_00769 [Treponema phagedenis F0421]|nr:hypothetical protein HMPREF9554_00769 [Treponema phagedenis F0421]